MDEGLRSLVWTRAKQRCEYCHLPSQVDTISLQFDHIVPRKHGGTTSPENLALSCIQCNAYKGPNLTGIDPLDGAIVRLFHPRQQRWEEHFTWDAATLLAKTPEGRAALVVMRINAPDRIELRQLLMTVGVDFN